MHRNKKKRNIIIFSLVGVLLCMVAGYAAFQTRLEIKGTSKVTSNWDIRITNVTDGTPTGQAENAVAPKWTNLTASMEANLYDKGDAMEYDVTIENKGTLDAKLNDILTNIEKENNDAVLITFSGYAKGEILKAGGSKLVHVKIEYNPDYEGGETSSEVEINFNYTQNNNETTPSDKMHLVTYNCTANGGTSCTSYNEYLLEGNNIDLTHEGSAKKYYNFVGWNTDKNATNGLSSLQMGVDNITLYAIYKEIDPSNPIIDNISTTSTTNSITVVVTAHDDESGISKYEYSIDGGKTWIDGKASNTYTFTGLTENTSYTVDVRVTNGVDKTATSNKDSSTTTLTAPTFQEKNTATDKTVIITYPKGCGTSLTCTYQKDDGEIITVTDTTVEVAFTESGSLVASINDGSNSVSSSYTVTYITSIININSNLGGSVTVNNKTKGTSATSKDGNAASIKASTDDSIEITTSLASGFETYSLKKDDTPISSGNTSIMGNNGYTVTGLFNYIPGVYRIQVSGAISKALELYGDDNCTGNMCIIDIWDWGSYTSYLDNQWEINFYSMENNIAYYQIINKRSGKCVNMRGDAISTTGSNQVWTWDCNGGTGNLWYLIQPDSNLNWIYSIVNKGGLCLDITNYDGSSISDGMIVQGYQCNNTIAQYWQFGSI